MQKSNVEPDLSVPEVSTILRVAPIKVRGWIRKGELIATNTSDSDRPCYVVTREALERFRKRRSGAVQDKPEQLPPVEKLV